MQPFWQETCWPRHTWSQDRISHLLCDHQAPIPDSGEASHSGRHAVLHDFCMLIPYSAVIAAAGLVTLLLGSRTVGVQLLLGGAVMAAAAASSLSRWKRKLPSRFVTTFAAGGQLCARS